MRISRLNLLVIASAGAVLVAGLVFTKVASRGDKPIDGLRMMTALAEYRRDLRARGEPLPSSVTLDALVRSGQLRREDIKAFEGVTVVLHSGADEKQPQGILMEAHMPDGTWIVMMGDGSVQQMTPARYKEVRRNSGQPIEWSEQPPSVSVKTPSDL